MRRLGILAVVALAGLGATLSRAQTTADAVTPMPQADAGPSAGASDPAVQPPAAETADAAGETGSSDETASPETEGAPASGPGGMPDQLDQPGGTPSEPRATANNVSLYSNLVWARENGSMVMSEGVRAEYQGTKITADRCDYDRDAETALFYPYVVLERDGEKIVGERCLFHLDDRTWVVWNATAELSPEFFSGWTTDMSYVHAERIEGNDDYALLTDAYFTTTPRARLKRDTETGMLRTDGDPQWRLASDSVRIDNRGNYIKLGASTLYVDRTPVFWLPSFGVSRSFLTKANYIPQVGQNSSEGWYASWAYPYYQNNLLRVRFTQKQGETYGLDYRYNKGATSFDLVANYRTKSNSFTGSADLRTEFLGGSFTAGYNLSRSSALVSGSSTTETRRMSYSIGGGAHSLNLSANQNITTSTQRRQSTSATAAYRWRWSDTTELSANLNYSSNDTVESGSGSSDLVANEELTSVIRLTSRQQAFDWEVVHEQRVDPDGDAYTGDNNFGSIERMPQITVRSDLSRMGVPSRTWSATVEASAGRLHEASTGTRTARYGVDVSARRKTINWGITKIDLSGNYSQRWYGDETAIYNLGERANITTDWSDQLKSTFSYSHQTSAGYTPFRSDYMSRYHTASGNVTWNHNTSGCNQNASLATSYDLKLKRWSDLRLAYAWSGSAGNAVTLSTNYDLEDDRFRQLSVRYATRRFGWYDWQVSTGYDFRTGEITPIRSALDWEIDKDSWRLQFLSTYSPTLERLSQTEIALIHYTSAYTYCLSYRGQEKAVRFAISVRGLPNLVSDGFGIGSHGEFVTPTSGGSGLY